MNRRHSGALKADAATITPLAQHSTPIALEPWVDSAKAGEFLGFHAKTVERMARRGQLPGYPVGAGDRKRWRFLLSELDAWMRSRVPSHRHPCRIDTGDRNV
jgi:excisionase family DNA binding protein